jgi:DNA-directed RNA polymerase specialized sigma24 family protein
MFEFLLSINGERAVNVANHSIRLLEWRRVLTSDLDSGRASFAEDLSLGEQRLASQVVAEIQSSEKVHFSEVTESAVEKYLLELARIASKSADKTLSESDLRRGRMILAAWKEQREEFGEDPTPEILATVAAAERHRHEKVGPSARRVRDVKQHRRFWERLCVEFYQLLVSQARTLAAGDLRLAEDIAQTTVVRVLRYSPNPSAIANPGAYLRRVVRNVWNDSKQASEVSLEDLSEDERSQPIFIVEPEILSVLENLEHLEQLPAKLSPELIVTLQLRGEGYTWEETAKALDEKVSRTKFRWYRFVENIHRRLAQ